MIKVGIFALLLCPFFRPVHRSQIPNFLGLAMNGVTEISVAATPKKIFTFTAGMPVCGAMVRVDDNHQIQIELVNSIDFYHGNGWYWTHVFVEGDKWDSPKREILVLSPYYDDCKRNVVVGFVALVGGEYHLLSMSDSLRTVMPGSIQK